MIICPRCAKPLPDWLLRDSHTSSICPQCQSALEVYCFPELYRSMEKLDVTQLASTPGDACCYEHTSKRAASLCSNCGRFLCALCEVQLGSQTLCPDCVQGQKVTGKQNSLETFRVKYDSIALALATWPVLLISLTFITAPLALGLAIYGWKRPTSIVRRNRWRIFTAAGLSALEIAGIVAFVLLIIAQAAKKKY